MFRLALMLTVILQLGVSVVFANITPDDFSFNGVSIINGNYEDLIIKMGEPKRKIEDEEETPAFAYLTYRNVYIQAYKYSGKIAYIKIADRDYKTRRNISLGSTPSKVIKEYGQPEKVSIRGHIYYVYKLTDYPDYRLLIDMTEGYASQIIYTTLTNKP